VHPQRPAVALLAVSALALSLVGCGARLTGTQEEAALGGRHARGGAAAGGPATATPAAGPDTGAGPTAGSNSGAAAAPSGTRATGPADVKAAAGTVADPNTAQCVNDGSSTDTGVTGKTITVANIADVSGPVPGIFLSARQGAQAFAAYWNATHGGICGRQIRVLALDSRTDAGGDRDAVLTACGSAFALVGSMSAFDNGGAQAEDACGIPDISVAAVTPEHQASKVTYATNSTKANLVPGILPAYFARTQPDAVGHAAFLYINAGASVDNAQSDIAGYQRYGHGWNFVYTQAIDVSAFNYAPYVQQMKSKGVRYVQFLGAYQEAAKLAQTMQAQGFKPDVFMLDSTAYTSDFVTAAQGAANGVYVYLNAAMLEDAGNPEVALYRQWLQRTSPGASPSYFGEYAWSSMMLFTGLAYLALDRLNRPTILQLLTHVDGWTGNGIHSPQHVGAKRTGECESFIQLQGAAWHKVYPAQGFDCSVPVIDSGVSG
jgi:ABC-type branched-subunit amino acid transport system substrate-binding protein